MNVDYQYANENQYQSTALARVEPQELAVNASANGAAIAAARTQIEARFALAHRRPRVWEDVRIRLTNDCKRPGFANSARYRKPAGKKRDDNGNWVDAFIEGPSARFAEAAFRNMGNAEIQAQIIYDDSQQRTVRIVATDLETNATSSVEITVEKTVERSKLKQGQAALSSRMNSYGDRVFLLQATDDETHNKVNSQVSKARRNLILQLLPADITEECMDLCVATMRHQDAKDPDAARRSLLDAFAGIGVMPSALEAYLDHDTSLLLPIELETLRAIFVAIRDGEATWKAVMETKAPAATTEKGEAKTEENVAAKKARAVIDGVKQRRAGAAAAAAAASTTPPASEPENPKQEKEAGTK